VPPRPRVLSHGRQREHEGHREHTRHGAAAALLQRGRQGTDGPQHGRVRAEGRGGGAAGELQRGSPHVNLGRLVALLHALQPPLLACAAVVQKRGLLLHGQVLEVLQVDAPQVLRRQVEGRQELLSVEALQRRAVEAATLPEGATRAAVRERERRGRRDRHPGPLRDAAAVAPHHPPPFAPAVLASVAALMLVAARGRAQGAPAEIRLDAPRGLLQAEAHRGLERGLERLLEAHGAAHHLGAHAVAAAELPEQPQARRGERRGGRIFCQRNVVRVPYELQEGHQQQAVLGGGCLVRAPEVATGLSLRKSRRR
jgi:hypothetical protein